MAADPRQAPWLGPRPVAARAKTGGAHSAGRDEAAGRAIRDEAGRAVTMGDRKGAMVEMKWGVLSTARIGLKNAIPGIAAAEGCTVAGPGALLSFAVALSSDPLRRSSPPPPAPLLSSQMGYLVSVLVALAPREFAFANIEGGLGYF